MSDMNSVVRLAVDAYKGRDNGKVGQYSIDESMDVLRKALVEANGGNTMLNYKNIRDGKCNEVFAIVESILAATIVGGFQGDEYFNQLVDFRNVALGDQNKFVVENGAIFTVSNTADGTQAVRRQRISGVTTSTITTQWKTVKFYDELNRVLSGQVDLNQMITKVSEAFRLKILDDIYSAWDAATSTTFTSDTYYPTAGSYSESALLTLIDHVEAAAGGKKATILGTKSAARHLAPSLNSTYAFSPKAMDEVYTMGYYGNFYGTPVVVTPQRHATGSATSFAMSDLKLHIIAGDEKPIKVVYEGQSTIILGDMMKNQDLTQDYMYGEKYGIGLVLSGSNTGFGRYEMTS